MNAQKAVPLLLAVLICILCACSDDQERNDFADESISKEQIKMMKLRNRLENTAWTWPDPDFPDSKAWFQLKSDGTAIAGWHSITCLWTVTSGSTIRMMITSASRELKDVKFNSDITEAEMCKAFLTFPDRKKEIKVIRRIEPSILEDTAVQNRNEIYYRAL